MNADPPNEDLADIEAALRRLKPRAPSAICTARIAAKLDATAGDTCPARAPRANTARIIRWAVPLLAAAACAAFLLVPVGNFSTPPQTQSVSGENILATEAASNEAESTATVSDDEAADILQPDADEIPIETIHVAASTPAPVRSELRSAEPLEIHRAPDGRMYQPYRIRYKNTVPVSTGRGRAPTMLRAFPSEEVHFVHLDNRHADTMNAGNPGTPRAAQTLTRTEVRQLSQRIANRAAAKDIPTAHCCPHHSAENTATVPTTTITLTDGDSTIRLTCKGACRCLNVTTTAGETLFAGPVETPEDRRVLSPEISRKLQIVEQLSPPFTRPEHRPSAGASSKPEKPNTPLHFSAPVRIRT